MRLVHFFYSSKVYVKWDPARQISIRNTFAKLSTDVTGKPPPSDFESLKSSVEIFKNHGYKLIGFEGDLIDMSRIKQGLRWQG